MAVELSNPSPARDKALEIQHLSKTFGGVRVLSGIELTVPAGRVVALLGENGSGKSTLIKILSGYHYPDPGGAIRIGGRALALGSPSASLAVGARFVHQELGLVEDLTVLDNLALEGGYPTVAGTIRRRAAFAQARDVLRRVDLDVDPNALVRQLPPAHRTAIAVARALKEDDRHPASLLVLDEPTATLPEHEIAALLQIVRAVADTGVGVLYVTHRLDEVFDVAESAIVLRDGKIHAQTPVSELTRSRLVQQIVGRELGDLIRASRSVPELQGDPVIEVENLRAGALRGVSFTVQPGKIIGFAGITGSGRDDLLPAIFGATSHTSGKVRVSGRDLVPGRPDLMIEAGVAMVPAKREQLGGSFDLTARENMTVVNLAPFFRRGLLRKRAERTEVEDWFSRLDIRPKMATELPLRAFSGGNKQKVMFAKWLRSSPKVMLVDEPTQGVDLGARSTLHKELLDAARNGTAVLVASADTDELAALCHTVCVLYGGVITRTLAGVELTARELASACIDGKIAGGGA